MQGRRFPHVSERGIVDESAPVCMAPAHRHLARSNLQHRIWIPGFVIVVCIMIGVIASNAWAALATLAWDPNAESDLAGL